jgi:circadian clock protein KaiB
MGDLGGGGAGRGRGLGQHVNVAVVAGVSLLARRCKVRNTRWVRAVALERGGVSLRLYVAGDTAPSAQARRHLAALRERLGGEHWEVEVVDVFERPGLAEADRILATPVLMRLFPEARLSVIGDFSDVHVVATALDLEKGLDRS